MPTTHVEPGCDPLLQEIANTLWKARKVVVITGAGISTNSGIPDFRSENGLYSLIQAQFDAAQQQAVDGSGNDADVSDASLEERPAKRPRFSNDTPERPFPGLYNPAARNGGVTSEPANHSQLQPSPQPSPEPRPHGELPEREPTAPLAERSPLRSTTPLPSPPTSPRRQHADDTNVAQSAPDYSAVFASSPPRLALGTPRPRSRLDLLNSLPGSSSPLSSPPPVTFDPYQESPSSSSQDEESSRFSSEEPSSQSTPQLSSQTSFASSRASLPVMKGKDLFDAQIWACPRKTSVFYTFVSTLRQKVRSAEPTSSHQFVSVLRDSRKLVRCYTQNIDQLEERVGLSTSLSLGPGNRYRFSLKAGRSSTGAKASNKAVDAAADASQVASQSESRQQGEPLPEKQQQPAQATSESAITGGAQDSESTVQPSQSSSDPNSARHNALSSTPSGTTASLAPPAPNRGVECVFLHGSLAELRCFVCARTASWDEETRLADTLAGLQPTCPHCAGATAAREERGKRALGVGKLRPDIVLYGEEHPHAHLISPLVQHDLSLGPDMLLILGTSMRVHGLKVLVREFAKAVHDRGGKVVFVNFTKPPESVWADIIDYWVQWDCDAWVGDLQQRKPALWLPPGTALPEEEKQKSAKVSRRQSGAEPSRRKDGAEKNSKRRREGDAPVSSEKREDSELSVVEQTTSDPAQPHEVPTPPPPPKRVPKRPAKSPREPKLNPDAKRPMATRDHKLNGAYLVWNIMKNLRRLTGRPTLVSATPPRPKPRPKKPRKSAPAALEGLPAGTGEANAAKPSTFVPFKGAQDAVPASSPLPSTHLDGRIFFTSDSSISAAVKSRKRKQTVAWRMIRGVETRVSLNEDVPEPELPPLPHTTAVFRPSSVPLSVRLPPPTPTTPRSSPQFHHYIPPQTISSALSTRDVLDLDAGFRETDRLIAQMQHQEASQNHHPHYQQQQEPLQHLHQPQQLQSSASPSNNPLLLLPPLQRLPPHDEHKPAALEPKVESPGPRAEISSNVGSPVAARMSGNPFFLADPLAGWLRSPPGWWAQRRREGGEDEGGSGEDGVGPQRLQIRGFEDARWPRQQSLGHDVQDERPAQQHGLPQQQQRPQQHLKQHQGQWSHDSPGSGFQHDRLGINNALAIDEPRHHTPTTPTAARSPWCPEEQLRKEQEAALIMSAMRGTPDMGALH